jgi:hypothetical protein
MIAIRRILAVLQLNTAECMSRRSDIPAHSNRRNNRCS